MTIRSRFFLRQTWTQSLVPPSKFPQNGMDSVELRYQNLLQELTELGTEFNRFLHRIGMHRAVSFDRIYNLQNSPSDLD
jgi:hypothetical protein